MMNHWFSFFGAVLFALTATGVSATLTAGPILVGKGAGESEYALIWTRARLGELLRSCEDVKCEMTDRERLLLARLRELSANAPTPLFESQAKLGMRLFELRGSNVVFNQDRLWLDSARTMPYEAPHALVLWIEVLATDRALDRNDLSSVEEKLMTVLGSRITRVTLSTRPERSFGAILWRRLGDDSVTLRDPASQTVDLTPSLKAATECSAAGGARDLRLNSARWSELAASEETVTLLLNLSAAWSCGSATERGRFAVALKASRKGGASYAIEVSSLRVRQEGE